MIEYTLIKDPTYGYVSIPKKYIKEIIDSETFQRLRDIRQTSYSSVYPNSSHNRFIHSIGVFHLGSMTFNYFSKNCRKILLENNFKVDEYKSTLEVACLLHDVGHSPFSHTGEDLFLEYLDNKEEHEIYSKLREKFNSEKFLTDFENSIIDDKVAEAHEIMSVIISIEAFNDFLIKEEVDIELFARMVLGLELTSNDFESNVKNCLIQFVNSNVIDVDRLDYLVRDMNMTGIGSTQIDLHRLLSNICLVEKTDFNSKQYLLGYNKSALSVIQNVILAHDSERKWIQNHPVIKYDSHLTLECMKIVNEIYTGEPYTTESEKIFRVNSLTTEGHILKNGKIIKCLSDSDFIHNIKQYDGDNEYYKEIKSEFFSRQERKKPIWKSESEFNILLKCFTECEQKVFLDIFKQHSKNIHIGDVLNQKNLDDINCKIAEYFECQNKNEDIEKSLLINRKWRFWLKSLKKFALENNVEFNFFKYDFSRFESGIYKLHTDDILIDFDNINRYYPINKITTLYSSESKQIQNSNLFYLYVRKNSYKSNTDGLQKAFYEFAKKTVRKFMDKFEIFN